jgi:hypothetical protein
MKLPTRLLMAAAAAALLSLTAACGAGGTSDSGTGTASGGGLDKAAICDKARQALQDFSQNAGASAGDFSAYNKAVEQLSTELDNLAGQADGDLKSALSEMSTTFGSFTIDAGNPVESAQKVLDAAKQATEQGKKLGEACA